MSCSFRLLAGVCLLVQAATAHYQTVIVPHVNPDICAGGNGENQDGLYAHPHSCIHYLQCVHGKPTVRACGKGTYWNDLVRNCGFWQTSYCAIKMKLPVPTEKCACNDYKFPTVVHPTHPTSPPYRPPVQPPSTTRQCMCPCPTTETNPDYDDGAAEFVELYARSKN